MTAKSAFDEWYSKNIAPHIIGEGQLLKNAQRVAWNAALEEAKKACEPFIEEPCSSHPSTIARECVEAIRRLKDDGR